jgi:hypothetical protein
MRRTTFKKLDQERRRKERAERKRLKRVTRHKGQADEQQDHSAQPEPIESK